MKLMDMAQQALNSTARQLRRRFPIGFWVSAANALEGGVFEFIPKAGPLAGAPVRLPVDQFIFPYVMARGSWQPEHHQRLGRSLTADSVLVDIGANLGLYARQMLRDFPQLHRAICFEPEGTNFALMRQNLAHVNDKVRLVQAALSESTGTATLHKDPVNVGNYSLVHSATGDVGMAVVQTMAIAEAESMVLNEANGKRLVYKSDTQGYDEHIACHFSDAFWAQVSAAALEIWQLPGKPPLDEDRFTEILARFPRREFTTRPGQNLSVEEVVAFARGTSGADVDLFLER